jgi:hypothetical protein
MDTMRQIARAIAFAHDLAKHYLDPLPIAAALTFIEGFYREAESMEITS